MFVAVPDMNVHLQSLSLARARARAHTHARTHAHTHCRYRHERSPAIAFAWQFVGFFSSFFFFRKRRNRGEWNEGREIPLKHASSAGFKSFRCVRADAHAGCYLWTRVIDKKALSRQTARQCWKHLCQQGKAERGWKVLERGKNRRCCLKSSKL